MKELRYILAVLFSSLIIISGVGISVVQYCCAGCETGCTAVYYKVDFVKHAHESVSFVPFLTLFCEQLPLFDHSLPQVACTPRVVSGAPPYVVGSRHYLALYSTLLI